MKKSNTFLVSVITQDGSYDQTIITVEDKMTIKQLTDKIKSNVENAGAKLVEVEFWSGPLFAFN